jgi:hypothetical protein
MANVTELRVALTVEDFDQAAAEREVAHGGERPGAQPERDRHDQGG